MTKRSPVTSMESHVRIVQAARYKIPPPDHVPLTDIETIHFDAIISEKANAYWTEHEIDIAAFLARMMRSACVQGAKLAEEGYVVEGAQGQPKSNPRQRIESDIVRQILSYRRSLGIHGGAKCRDVGDHSRRNSLSREMQDDALGDGLLARPRKPN